MNADTIRISVRFDGRSRNITIRKYAQVFELFKILRKEVVKEGDSSFTLIYHGKSLEENEEGDIETLGIRNLDTIDVCIKTLGGGGNQSKGDVSTTKAAPTVVVRAALPSRSREKCCIFNDEMPGDVCYRMPCGCVYSTMAIKAYGDTVVNTEKNFSFSCQVCFTSWSYDAVRHVLTESMEEEELIEFNERLNDNYAAKQLTIRKCPTCKNLVTRDFSKYFPNPYYVKCVICTSRTGSAVEFCWCCLKLWNSSSGSSCGNIGCLGKDPRIQFLETCRTKKIGEVSNVPIARACVKCNALIQHADKCKHMTCRCGFQFCFVCLKTFDTKTNSWSCGSWNDECPVASRQTSLFK